MFIKYKKIKSIDYMLCGDKIKIVITTKSRTFDAKLVVGDKTFVDCFNDDEPYDRHTHVFYIPKNDVNEKTNLRLEMKCFSKRGIGFFFEFVFGNPNFADESELLQSYDNGLTLASKEKETIDGCVEYEHNLYKDRNNKDVHVFVAIFESKKASLYVGTPNDGYESVKVRATIPEMIASAKANGVDVITAVNADFFDIFGDFHPAGLCVKNGKIVANPNSKRNFIATLKGGGHVITSLEESPEILPQIDHAASGLQMIVKDGKINEFAPLEPFSFVRHPRTAVGIRKDGTVIVMVVDGRIPDYSNGASLVDLAKLMISYGADRALNLDGGGSSAIYTKNGSDYILRSRPADLFRPTARLIRKDFNSLLVRKLDN